MNILLLLIIFFSTVSAAEPHSTPSDLMPRAENVLLLDSIKVILYTSDGSAIITQSDLDRPGLGGQIRSLDELIFDQLVYLDAVKFNMLPDDQAVEESITKIQKDNNLTRDQLDELFVQGGFTAKEGMQELKRMQAISTMFDFKIRSNLIVPRSAIVDYYNANPVFADATYQLEQAFIPFSTTKSKKEQRILVDQFVTTGKRARAVQWSEPFWVMHADVAADKQFIYTMRVGDIKVIEDANGFVLFRLKDKKDAMPLSLEARYQEIADILRRPRFEELMEAYKKELFENASIVYK